MFRRPTANQRSDTVLNIFIMWRAPAQSLTLTELVRILTLPGTFDFMWLTVVAGVAAMVQ